MKRLNKIFCIGIVASIIFTGCGDSDSGRKVKNKNSVDAVLQNEIEKSTQEEKTTVVTTTTEATTETTELAVVVQPTTENENAVADPNVDLDISVMSSDMVYATVYQMMTEPDGYVGKTIKIKGNHYSSFYEPTGLIYHYALIQDATACCAQGLEFELANGVEYPDEDEEVIVVGTFETYEEEGYLYAVLRNAVIQ